MTESRSDPAFYVGRSSFHMEVEKTPAPLADKVAAAAGSSSPAVSESGALPPTLLIPPPMAPPRDLRSAVLERGLTMSRSMFAGFCLTAFACGIVTTVALDRVWPRVDVEPARSEQSPSAEQAAPAELTASAEAPSRLAPGAKAEQIPEVRAPEVQTIDRLPLPVRPVVATETAPASELKLPAIKAEAVAKHPRVAGSPTPIARKRAAARPTVSEPVGRTTASTASVDDPFREVGPDEPLPPKAKWTDPFE